MNRFVSLLLVAFSLAAVTLAQPAQAQQGQWYRGLPYFLNSNTQSSQPGTSVTATINNSTTGHLNITSTPINASPGYSTGGTFNGSVGVYYVWSGGSLNKAMVLSTTQSLDSSGTGTGNESGNSNAGDQARGNFSPGSTGWDSPATPPAFTYYFDAGVTPPSKNQVVALSGTVSAYYYSSNPGSTIVTADVTFGPPVVTQ